MNAANVTLTDAEWDELIVFERGEDERAESLRSRVESIVAARVADALKDVRQQLLDLLVTDHLPDGVEEHPEGCCDICDWVGCLQDEHLLALADEYAPRADS